MSAHSLISILTDNQDVFVPVVPFSPGKDKLVQMDFTAGNTSLTDDILADLSLFMEYINNKLKTSQARFGIGGYGEHRTIYRMSRVFDAKEKEEEPRRLHLGTDIWGRPYTPVYAPLDGIIHSYAFNNHFGDYGATLILSHQLDQCSFYTLYGHLSLQSITNCYAGETVRRGEVIAEFGIPAENGQWPSHLHFQVITTLEGREGDYPGVCKFSERAHYINNCPDPELILQMNKYIK